MIPELMKKVMLAYDNCCSDYCNNILADTRNQLLDRIHAKEVIQNAGAGNKGI